MKFSLAFFVLSTLVLQGLSQEDFSYKRYLYEKQITDELKDFIFEDSLSSSNVNHILVNCEELNFQSFQFSKYHLQYLAYDAESNSKKATETLEQLVIRGYEPQHKFDEPYLSLINQDSLIKVREGQNDFSIIAFFRDMESKLYKTEDSVSFELNRKAIPLSRRSIDSFINTFDSWIGYDVRGNHAYYGKKFTSMLNLVEWDMDEKTLNKYYNTIYSHCQKNNEDWRMAVRLKFWQFNSSQYGDSLKYTKLRNIELTPDGFNYEDDNTLLNIRALASYCNFMSSNKKVVISPTSLWGGGNFDKYMVSLYEKLIEFDVDYNSIILEHKIVELDENEEFDNDYFFVFKMITE